MSIFIIHPFSGYNNVKFNISQDELIVLDGVAPKILIDNIINETYEYRNGSIKLTFIEKKFVDIWIPERPADNQVYINGDKGFDFFNSNNIELIKKKYQWIESKDKKRMLFPEIGVCALGCGDKKSKEGKIIIAFCKERLPWYKTFINA